MAALIRRAAVTSRIHLTRALVSAPAAGPVPINALESNITTVNNRNPRSAELTGSRPKALGLVTIGKTKKFYHR